MSHAQIFLNPQPPKMTHFSSSDGNFKNGDKQKDFEREPNREKEIKSMAGVVVVVVVV